MRVRAVAILLAILSGLAWGRDWTSSVENSLGRLPPRLRISWLRERGFETPKSPLPDSQNVRCVGRWPFGPSFSITGKDSLIFLGSGSGVRIISITDTLNPRQIGQVAASGIVSAVVVKDSFLIVGSSGVEIFSVIEPRRPSLRSRSAIPVADLALADSVLYVASDDSLRLLSIRDPGSPRRLGACLDSGATCIAVTEGNAYTGHRWNMNVIDVNNPANPHQVNSMAGNTVAIETRGHLCYATNYDNNTFRILSVHDPLNIRALGVVTDLVSWGFYVTDWFAYVAASNATGGRQGTFVLDVTDSLNPVVVGNTRTPGFEEDAFVFGDLNHVFLADDWEGLAVVDVHNPGSPACDTSCFAADMARDVAVVGQRAFVADEMAGLRVIDISNLAQPMEVGSYDTVGVLPESYALAAQDSLVYLSWNARLGIRTIDVADPTHPRQIGTGQVWNYSQALAIRDTLLYDAENSRLEIFSIANPRSPRLVGSCGLADNVWDLFISDTLAFVTDLGGVQVVNISRPDNPVLVASHAQLLYSMAICVVDTVAYLSSSRESLWVWSFADPLNPYRLGAAPIRGFGYDVTADGHYAYVGSSRLEVIDVSDPSDPRPVGCYDTPDHVRRVTTDGAYVYAACFGAGVCIFETLQTGVEERGASTRARRAPEFVIDLSPNPASAYVDISFNSTQPAATLLSVQTVSGRRVDASVRCEGAPRAGRFRLDLSGLVPGIYFVTARAGHVQRSAKLIKN